MEVQKVASTSGNKDSIYQQDGGCSPRGNRWLIVMERNRGFELFECHVDWRRRTTTGHERRKVGMLVAVSSSTMGGKEHERGEILTIWGVSKS